MRKTLILLALVTGLVAACSSSAATGGLPAGGTQAASTQAGATQAGGGHEAQGLLLLGRQGDGHGPGLKDFLGHVRQAGEAL